jgi:hypothetical protein
VGQILKEREILRTGALKSGSTHIALTVRYKPLAGTQVLSCSLLYSYNGLGAFHQFPKGETLLNERERQRERERERERERRLA